MVTRVATVLGACLIFFACTADGNGADADREGAAAGVGGSGAGAGAASADAALGGSPTLGTGSFGGTGLTGGADAQALSADAAVDEGSCVATPEVCDALDNDCDGALDEGLPSSCKTERCPADVRCASGTACDPADGRCVPATACDDAAPGDLSCDVDEESWWQPRPCDPQACARWQSGTCWADCRCAEDGIFRWAVGCTE